MVRPPLAWDASGPDLRHQHTPSALKKDYLLPSNIISNADITRLINSSEVQSALREPKGEARTKRTGVQKKNPLKNKQVMLRLNPYAAAFSKQKLGQASVESGKPERAGEAFHKILNEA
ncbi:60S ribosomal protein L4-A [Coccidioides immitis H538.4]|uniref:60S ribosomal protein L4-A n=1 Tax=Coccidioides immitis H538.4 TaxID=396776 RepID=A0A0J8U7W4_COCIT|nr:60S ribosomal protein L4-A [Coccidioides immitis H538.4]